MESKSAVVKSVKSVETRFVQKAQTKKKAKKKLSKKEIEALILDHYEHGKRLAWSFLMHWRMRMRQDEVSSVVGAALCEAAHRFDPSKGVQFKTFFFYHLRGMLLKEITRIIQEQKMVHCVPYAGSPGTTPGASYVLASALLPLVDNNNPEKMMAKRQIAAYCWEACSTLDTLEREVVVRHFLYDEPLVDIASELDYCRCHISRVKSRALKKLERHMSGRVRPDRDFLLTRPEPSASRPQKGRDYTGGRGRRKQKKSALKSVPVDAFFKEAVNS